MPIDHLLRAFNALGRVVLAPDGWLSGGNRGGRGSAGDFALPSLQSMLESSTGDVAGP